MALWVDKYRPHELSKLDYHVEQASDLKRLCEHQDFPHLMFFGPNGKLAISKERFAKLINNSSRLW